MRREFYLKTFLCILLIGSLILCAMLQLTSYNAQEKKYNQSSYLKQEIVYTSKSTREKSKKDPNMKYILQWTSSKTVPFVYMGVGQETFIRRNCSYTNCVVTSNVKYFDKITEFDVIAFAGPELILLQNSGLPHSRSPAQKYVFASIESAENYPLCSDRFDGYFNWTWTYRLDSESRWGYIVVRDVDNKIIGPKKNMNWLRLEDMDPVSSEFKQKLKTKTKAAAWFVSNCQSRSKREDFAEKLNEELSAYKLGIDAYGKCGWLSCDRDRQEECGEKIKNKYYFYLAFENAFSEDYVTEKVLHGLQNNAIPIVYGGANYSRFMPPGIYLDARELGVKKLAKKMYELIEDPESYAEYFRWKNHYSFHGRNDNSETDDYCGFCQLLNNKEMLKGKSVIEKFRKWWDPPEAHECYYDFFK